MCPFKAKSGIFFTIFVPFSLDFFVFKGRSTVGEGTFEMCSSDERFGAYFGGKCCRPNFLYNYISFQRKYYLYMDRLLEGESEGDVPHRKLRKFENAPFSLSDLVHVLENLIHNFLYVFLLFRGNFTCRPTTING